MKILSIVLYPFYVFAGALKLSLRVAWKFLKANAKAILYLSLSLLFFTLGVIGAIFPVLPAIPFFILSFVFALRISDRLTAFIMKTKIGEFMRREISMKLKISLIISFWLSIALPSVLLSANPYIIGVSVGFCVIATAYILYIKRFADMLGKVAKENED